ncbi:MAG: DsbC family protein [Xanthomonadales bacterium]|nr:DsbC family protein [Xanthomonadales bacterium]
MPVWIFLVFSLSATHASEPVQQAVAGMFPPGTEFEVFPSPVAGVVEVVAGTQVFYLTQDGQYLLGGPLFSLGDSRNLTEQRLGQARLDVLSRSRVPSKVRFAAAEPAHQVTVVTNVDCGYCRTMHTRLQEYLDLGITFDYVMLPSGGTGSPAFRKTAGLLCAEDPADAVTRAMTAGQFPAGASGCDHGLEAHVALARDLGANTTPNLLLPDGRLIRGYLPPADLLRTLQASE